MIKRFFKQGASSSILIIIVAFIIIVAVNACTYFTYYNLQNELITRTEVLEKIRNSVFQSTQMVLELATYNVESTRPEIKTHYHTGATKENIKAILTELSTKIDSIHLLEHGVVLGVKIEDYIKYTELSIKMIEQKENLSAIRIHLLSVFEAQSALFLILDRNLIQVNNQIKIESERINWLYLMLFFLTLSLGIIATITFFLFARNSQVKQEEVFNVSEKLDTIINSVSSIIITIDKEGNVTLWNSSAEQFFNISAVTILGKNLFAYVPMFFNYRDFIMNIFQTGRRSFLLQQQSNEPHKGVFFNLHVSHIARLKSVLIRVENVTQQQIQEEQLRQNQKLEVVQNLVQGMALSFNNALGAITGTVSMIRYAINTQQNPAEDIQNKVDIIEQSAEKASIMVQQILTLFASQKEEMHPMDPMISVYHVLKLCENTFDKSIEIKSVFQQHTILIEGDSIKFEQMLLNLCDNAAQAMTSMRSPKETQGGILSLSTSQLFPDKYFKDRYPSGTAQSYWVLTISDTGVGIPDPICSKIFDPFFTTKNQGESSGLGLTLVYEFIKRHNGFIDVKSKYGKGTIITLYFPEYIPIGGLEMSHEKIEPRDHIPVGSGEILIVDDEEVMRKTAQAMTEKLGYTVWIACDGVDAMEIYKEKLTKIRVVLLDMSMPRMNGLETFLQMKAINPEVKVILMSGLRKDERIQKAMNQGVHHFLKKPYSLVDVANIIQDVLNDSSTNELEHSGTRIMNLDPYQG